MLGLLKEKVVKETLDLLRVVQVTLCSELVEDYRKSMDLELAGVLSAQVVNFLTGEDNEVTYYNANLELKQKIDLIKDKIVPMAFKKMDSDFKTRELIVYTLRVKSVAGYAINESYINSPENLRIEKILSKYGPEFPEEAKFDKYKIMVKNYSRDRFKS